MSDTILMKSSLFSLSIQRPYTLSLLQGRPHSRLRPGKQAVKLHSAFFRREFLAKSHEPRNLYAVVHPR